MIKIITETKLKPGQEEEWDRIFQDRVAQAGMQPGWIGVELLVPTDDPSTRVVIGSWRSQEDWDRWHASEAFQQTRSQLAPTTQDDGQPQWFTVDISAVQAAQA